MVGVEETEGKDVCLLVAVLSVEGEIGGQSTETPPRTPGGFPFNSQAALSQALCISEMSGIPSSTFFMSQVLDLLSIDPWHCPLSGVHPATLSALQVPIEHECAEYFRGHP